MTIADEKYIAFTTFRSTGDPVSTPTWVVPVSDGRIGFWTAMGTGKTKRLENDPRVTVQACDARGRVREGSPVLGGEAEMVRSGRLFDEVHAKVTAKYGLMTRISKAMGRVLGRRRAGQTYADTVVLVRLDS